MNNVTRIEVIGPNGREFTKLLKDSTYEVSVQDDGKTLKLFEKRNLNEENSTSNATNGKHVGFGF